MEVEPTHRQYLILSITLAIQELASAINVAQMHEDYTDEQLENYMEKIAEMYLLRYKDEEEEIEMKEYRVSAILKHTTGAFAGVCIESDLGIYEGVDKEDVIKQVKEYLSKYDSEIIEIIVQKV